MHFPFEISLIFGYAQSKLITFEISYHLDKKKRTEERQQNQQEYYMIRSVSIAIYHLKCSKHALNSFIK